MAAFFSQPSDGELLEVYLRHRVDTGETPSPLFHTADVYSVHPADLTRQFPPLTSRDGESCWYFYTTHQDKTSRDARIRRRVASGGNWHGDRREKAILAGRGGEKIGGKKTFAFGLKEGGKLLRLGWLMVEVGFADGGGGGGGRGRVVLCKIYRSPRTDAEGSQGPNDIADDAALGTSTCGSPSRGPKNTGGDAALGTSTCGSPSRGPKNTGGDAPPRASTGSPTLPGESRGAAPAPAPEAEEGSRGPKNIGSDTPPRPSTQGSPAAAERSRGAAPAPAPEAEEGSPGPKNGSDTPPSASTHGSPAPATEATEGSRRGPASPRASTQGSPTAAGGATTRGGSESEVAGRAASAACGQDRCLHHSAARACKAPRKEWVLAQIELDGEDDSLDEPFRLCKLRRVGAPKRTRKEMECSGGWLVLGSAAAAAVREASSSPCPRCGERLFS